MRPGFVVLNMEQGATYNDTLNLTDPAGAPINLTGRAARMQIRSDYGDLILELSTLNGRIKPLDATGVITFHVTAADTALMPAAYDFEQWAFDIEMTYMDGLEEIVERPARGVVLFWKELTV